MQIFYRILLIALTIVLLFVHTTSFSQDSSTDEVNAAAREPNDQDGDFRYISDNLFTYLRAGPGTDYRLLGSVTAGTKVQLLQVDRQAGYAEVIDQRQRTGWVETKFVSKQASIREQFEQLNKKLSQSDAEVLALEERINAMKDNTITANKQKALLNRQITKQLEDIAKLNESIDKRQRNNNMQWFTRGAVIAVISLLIGYLMGLFGRKKNRSSGIM